MTWGWTTAQDIENARADERMLESEANPATVGLSPQNE